MFSQEELSIIGQALQCYSEYLATVKPVGDQQMLAIWERRRKGTWDLRDRVDAIYHILPSSAEILGHGGFMDVASAAKYVTKIKNPEKRAYATAYFAYLRGLLPESPKAPEGLSGIAAQTVRMTLGELLTEGEG